MKKRIILAGVSLILSWPGIAHADISYTTPVLVVQPLAMDFGVLRMGESATNSFLVENPGKGILVGTATVAPPFKILSGGRYKLESNSALVVTIVYTQDAARTNTQTVTFTGPTSRARATVTGRLSTKRWPYYLKRK